MADYYGGRTMYSKTDECYDTGRHGGSQRVYSHTDECYDDVDRRRPGAYADDCYNGAGYGGVYSLHLRGIDDASQKQRPRLSRLPYRRRP